MADVIRKGIIEIETRQKKAKLEAPDFAPVVRAHVEVAKAAGLEAKALEEATVAGKQHAEAIKSSVDESRLQLSNAGRSADEFSLHTVHSFERAGHGALQVARGIALMSASGEEDMRRLAEKVVLLEGAFGSLKGSVTVVKSLSAAVGVGLGSAVGVATAAILAGVAAWKLYGTGVARVTQLSKEQADAVRDAARAAQGEAVSGQRGTRDSLRAIERQRAEVGGISALRGFARGLEQEVNQERANQPHLRGIVDRIEKGGFRGQQLSPTEVGAAINAEQRILKLLEERAGLLEKINAIERQDQQKAREALQAIGINLPAPSPHEFPAEFRKTMNEILDQMKTTQRDLYQLRQYQLQITNDINSGR